MLFLEDMPMEFQIINGEQLVWSRCYRGINYVYCHISLSAAWDLDKKELARYHRLFKKKINQSDDGTVIL